VCGERGIGGSCKRFFPGSSPRVRGTLSPLSALIFLSRFIPACAGNAHGNDAHSFSSAGSSPRVRGTQRRGREGRPSDRFIPACAGNASSGLYTETPHSVHPRVCGERAPVRTVTVRKDGSSPRVRGTHLFSFVLHIVLRFIPACAGNASVHESLHSAKTVHPRVCGERTLGQCGEIVPAGSSPRVRGTPHDCPPQCAAWRFIPACAGNALDPATPPKTPTVHPRVCGERGRRAIEDAKEGGSSPRVRGTPYRVDLFQGYFRFIPACAGNADQSFRIVDLSLVHPRVCGERGLRTSFDLVLVGSSPRVRGTHCKYWGKLLAVRFIPACAGNAY